MIDRRAWLWGLTAIVLLGHAARAQVAFQPVVGAIPNGPVLNVTPAVSIDRRYVRLRVNAQFIGNVGFNTQMIPGAVGGGPGGPGALGAIGGAGGVAGLGGGGGVGAVGGGAAGGGQFVAGMNGVIAQGNGSGFGVSPMNNGYSFDPNLTSMQGQSFSPFAPPPLIDMSSAFQPQRRAPARKANAKAVRRGSPPKARADSPAVTPKK